MSAYNLPPGVALTDIEDQQTNSGRGYGWKITRDCFAEDLGSVDHDEDSTGVHGPHAITPRQRRELCTGGEPFRLLDDDRNLYFEGRIVGDHQGFEPLDDFGMPHAGCTIIQFRNKNTGNWEDL